VKRKLSGPGRGTRDAGPGPTQPHGVPSPESRVKKKVLSRSELLEAAARQRAAGRRIVFANGAFDLLHVGHVRYLEAARREGDWLAVGINSDRSVASAKGRGRPILPEAERAEIVSALACVDAVVVFDEDSPAQLLAQLRPGIHAKGTDYSEGSVPERGVVASYGGKTAIVGDPKDHATTDLIEKIRKAEGERRKADRSS
jgi:D-glycero-beta-D-manno-heptose 1-phosphate adenylyltransferase